MAARLARRLSATVARVAISAISCMSTLAACQPEADPSGPGPDCTLLLELATRAERCDPELVPLVEHVGLAPSESKCRIAARKILAPPTPRRPVRSMFDPDQPSGAAPLTEVERARMAAFPLPGTLVLRPDIPRGPGVPATVAELDGTRMLADERGLPTASVAPGHYTVTVSHAGEEGDHCVVLRACERLELTTHGSHLARRPEVTPGPCPP